MRILLIDNYDSFTYNIYHLLYRVTGQLPTVIKNDDPHWSLTQLEAFDAVVISPGPGHPANLRDMGISYQLLTQQQVLRPLLGICLGFQGIALLAGSQVTKAPRPVHGELAQVTHQGEGLFYGIPSPFSVVRYHSLAVTHLPECLQATAYSEDGVLMGLAHKTRPSWGCQFHPESICSEYGEQLLANFCQLARQFYQQQGIALPGRIMPAFSVKQADERALKRKSTFQLYVRQVPLPAGITTERLFCHYYADSPEAIWLDSNDLSSALSQFSLFADAQGPYARRVTADAAQQQVTLMAANTQQTMTGQAFFSWLEADLAQWHQQVADDNTLPFAIRPGWFGHLGYELKAESIALSVQQYQAADEVVPDAAMIFADRLLVIDHRLQQGYWLALAPSDSPEIAEQWFSEQLAQLVALAADISGSPFVVPAAQTLQLRHDPQVYLEKIKQCKEYIAQGESYEICLTNQLEWQLSEPIAPLSLYCALRCHNPTSFSAFIHWPDWAVLSFSPERFLKIDQQRIAESRPMKGTRKRGETSEQDRAFYRSLATDRKDRAENLMIVDLVRHDLGQVAQADGVKVSELFAVESYATVHQLVSTVQAKLAEHASAVECVRRAFPGGSMTGAPKKRTIELLEQLEEGPRGVYAGAIGYFSINGCADFNIVIRTLVMTEQRLRLGTGGSIIALSSPQEELAETALKARALLQPFGLNFPENS